MTENEAAVEFITRNLRGLNLRGADPEVVALELITGLRARGWRPTEAKPPPPWNQPRPGPGQDTYSRGLAAARQQLEAS